MSSTHVVADAKHSGIENEGEMKISKILHEKGLKSLLKTLKICHKKVDFPENTVTL